jgi:hypothetical protein
MAEPQLSMGPQSAEDDLPRTFRREKEARERQERDAQAKSMQSQAWSAQRAPSSATGDAGRPSSAFTSASADLASTPDFADRLLADSGKVTVGAFDVPFMHLVRFFLKAVIAAIPAMLLLFVVLWAIGQTAQKFMPWLVKLRIFITWQ